MILAGDIGGTKTLLALFDRDRRDPVALESYPSAEQTGLEGMIGAFLAEHPAEVDAAGFGVAGPVRDGHVDATNLARNLMLAAVSGPSTKNQKMHCTGSMKVVSSFHCSWECC